MKFSKFLTLALAGVMAFYIAGCGLGATETKSGGNALSGTITASGSSALLPLAKDAANDFKAKYADVSITLNGGGSGTGLKQVSEGSVNIGNSDVAAETKLSKEKAAELVDHKVAVVTIAPVVNKKIGDVVQSLTKQQLQDIFTGKVTNWKDVGGPDLKIMLVTRPATSGTRALFSEYALDKQAEATNKSLETDDSGTLIQTIADNEGAIGYVSLSYLVNNDKVATVSIDGVAPTLENTYNGKYSVWGYEHMYTKGNPNEVIKAFIDFIMSDEYGQKLEKQGYGVTSKMKVSR
ncbi:phosphate ABC transporter substrate-binding protein [Veillonella caviae]|uniref:phosphate ABC transporter substrate-binding protein n=1 Tax=Veillonella caviae TaxID=248316 RepID=UPI0023EF6662|nr:phosphate ABC transporter substrate-binding protein [Veillonella caviae]MCI6407954.1 phosphate ABC transporter substrate-binding protein [Veillonella caviae]MDY6224270.1 phosphate ABC transporter substrate-binding protein [Veillonella caviae]